MDPGPRSIKLHEPASQTVSWSVQLFCRDHGRDQQTAHWQTDHATPSRPRLSTAAMRPNTNINDSVYGPVKAI